MTPTAREARQTLYDVMRKDLSFEEKARQALELGQQYLGAQNGHLTRIDTETDHWEATVSTDPPDGQFPPGLELDLETTYCRRTIAADGPIALHDAPAQGWEDDPAFEEHGLHCYHGTTLTIDGDPYGTACFVAEDPREEPFSEGETMFAELIASLLERELERQHHEAELTRRNNLVNVLNRVLRHNLRNDMTVIRARAALMAEQLQEDASGSIALDKIDELIDLSRKARDLEQIVGQDAERTTIDIRTLVEHVIADISGEYPGASITLEATEDTTAAVLPSFDRALRELIENAAKHGGDTPTVEVSIETVPNAVEIRITDDGPGLDEQEREVLKTGAETPLVHGSGLGLWLVHWIVTSHDGTIDTTATDEGTTMTVSVPRSPATDEMQELAALKQARDQYEAAFDDAFDAMYILDDDARVIQANPQAASLYGVERPEFRGRSITEFLPDEFDFETVWTDLQHTGTDRDTATIVTATGEQRTIEYSATTDIVPGQHLVIARDITDRIGREEQLAQAETVFQHIQDAIFLIDVTDHGEFPVQRVNQVYEELTGIPNEEIQGKTPREVVGDEVGGTIEARYAECVERRETIEYVEEIPIDGETRYWQTKLTPIINDGSVVKLVGATRDVTDRKERQQKLRAERERFERLLDTSPVGIAILDRDGTFVRANERAEEVLGLSKSAITDRQYDDPEWDLVADDGSPMPSGELPFRRVMETGDPVYEYEHGIKTPDGSLRWLSVNAAPLTDSDSTIERVIVAITDITEQKGGTALVDGPMQ